MPGPGAIISSALLTKRSAVDDLNMELMLTASREPDRLLPLAIDVVRSAL